MYKVRGIFCLNSKCKHYFEDNCMLIWETDTVHISSEGECEDFEAGQHIGYANESALASATCRKPLECSEKIQGCSGECDYCEDAYTCEQSGYSDY